MSDDTSHKIDRTLSDIVKAAARERPGDAWGAVKRANHEMAIIWLALQEPDVQAEALAKADSNFATLDELVADLRDREFDSDFDPLGDFVADAEDAVEEQRNGGLRP